MSWETDPDRRILDLEYFVERATGENFDGNHPPDSKQIRRNLALLFDRVDRNVQSLHTPACSHHIAEAFLRVVDIPGPVVECGTFKGAMAAKLSILCKHYGKELYVFDSFKGLPHDEPCTELHTGDIGTWKKGWFTGHKPEVENSIKYWGCEQVTTLVEGWFEDTLHLYDIKPSFVFIDVDLVSSMKTCLEHFWPRLQGPYFFSHEATIKEYIEALLDKEWWSNTINCDLPSHIGVGTGYKDAFHLCRLNKSLE